MSKTKKSKLNRLISVILFSLASFVTIIAVSDNVIQSIKDSRISAIEDVKKRDFAAIWWSITSNIEESEKRISEVATNIENDIRSNFDLDELQQLLDNGDPDTKHQLSVIFRNNIDGVYAGDVSNNRNSVIILEGYDTIVEDLFVDPESREEGVELKDPSNPSLSKYKDTTYNKELFLNAMRKIRTHSDQIIAMEPYNYIDGEHEKLHEITYKKLEKIYLKEGVTGLRNYQFLVPVYITDSGDIFGQKDILNGVRQDNHKFIIIQTFNIYDQIMHNSPNFGDDNYIKRINARFGRILGAIYMMGLAICTLIIFTLVHFFSLYNILLSSVDDDDDDEKKNTNRGKRYKYLKI